MRAFYITGGMAVFLCELFGRVVGGIARGARVFPWGKPFWEQSVWRWDAMFAAGVRAHYFARELVGWG